MRLITSENAFPRAQTALNLLDIQDTPEILNTGGVLDILATLYILDLLSALDIRHIVDTPGALHRRDRTIMVKICLYLVKCRRLSNDRR